jgi:hypothetical protein
MVGSTCQVTCRMDGLRTEWCVRRKKSLGAWYIGASEIFSGTQVITIFFNGT